MDTVGIAMVGDFDGKPTQTATAEALAHSAAALGLSVHASWLATDAAIDAEALAGFDAFFIAPGSPYRSLEGALRAIQFAREGDVPLLGTCGGFQHAVIEYVRNVLGHRDADHAEYAPGAARLVVTPLECSLAGQRSAVILEAGSRAAAIYGATEIEEEYRCTFGLNPGYRAAVVEKGMRIVGVGTDGTARVIELPDLRFFTATLYVPQLSSTFASPHPLVSAFVAAAGANARRR